ncbi:hypothetical protein [Streptomyces hainanensis]|uniref:Uncharacterized protein n=1 Tax=Streptomyces hainanensis TaxID=402648 RepID=A0A4R4TQ13_9ACTN|nr:hypothetical protein [Streptomyces hainanensis]TDC76209.1 hypothetical protein E1283_10395 [Streptomyces hainanensis]
MHLIRPLAEPPAIGCLATNDVSVRFHRWRPPFWGPERRFCLSPDGALIAILVQENKGDEVWAIKNWDTGSLLPQGRIALPAWADTFEFSGQDRLAVVVNGTLAVFEVPA